MQTRRAPKVAEKRSDGDWRRLEQEAWIDPPRRIFVNRNLRMTRIEAVGFDMDHTLAQYNPRPFEELAFEMAKRKLLRDGYPRDIRRLEYDPAFVVRGLIVDKKRGNILSMDQHRYVARATHGKTRLPDEKRKTVYQRRLVRLSRGAYVPVDSPFSLPEIDLYAQLVDLFDSRGGQHPGYEGLYDDVRAAIDEVHADGSIKRRIARDLARYVDPDRDLPRTLARFRRHGYRLFLLTNSEARYTDLVMGSLLDEGSPEGRHWSETFDCVVVRAGKPDFFRSRNAAEGIRFGSRPSQGPTAGAFAGGGVGHLEKILGCRGDRILFFGDHTYGDILKSKRVCLWRTAMIVGEVEREVGIAAGLAGERRAIQRLRGRKERLTRIRDHLTRISVEPVRIRKRSLTRAEAARLLVLAEGKVARLEQEIARIEETCDRQYNPHWGPIFRTGGEPSYFAAQLREFACIYSGRVSNFLGYPVDKYFQVRPDLLPHEREED